MSLIDDWKSYIEEPSRFDKHHFDALMLELEKPADLHEAFDNLPSGHAFAEGLIEFRELTQFNGTYILPNTGPVTEECGRFAKAYAANVVDFLRDMKDPEATIIKANPIENISLANYRAGKKAGSLGLLQAAWTIDDVYIDYVYDRPPWIRGLREAVTMMTTIPEVTRHLLSPIVTYPLDERPAYDLWLRGHRLDFCRDRTLLIVDDV